MENYDINDYLKDDKELQKAVIQELLKELSTQQGTIDAYQMSENEANEIIAELKAENDKLREDYIKLSQQKDLDNVRWQKRCTDLHIEDKAKVDKYWLTLKEIKRIAENNQFCFAAGTTVDYRDLNKLSKDMGKILDLITKAEEE